MFSANAFQTAENTDTKVNSSLAVLLQASLSISSQLQQRHTPRQTLHACARPQESAEKKNKGKLYTKE